MVHRHKFTLRGGQNVAEIEKGEISSLSETTATVIPSFSADPVSAKLVIPFYLLRCLEVGMQVCYAMFEDNSGIILGRMDGEWNHDLDGDIRIRGDIQTAAVPSINGHTHTCPQGGNTGGPQ